MAGECFVSSNTQLGGTASQKKPASRSPRPRRACFWHPAVAAHPPACHGAVPPRRGCQLREGTAGRGAAGRGGRGARATVPAACLRAQPEVFASKPLSVPPVPCVSVCSPRGAGGEDRQLRGGHADACAAEVSPHAVALPAAGFPSVVGCHPASCLVLCPRCAACKASDGNPRVCTSLLGHSFFLHFIADGRWWLPLKMCWTGRSLFPDIPRFEQKPNQTNPKKKKKKKGKAKFLFLLSLFGTAGVNLSSILLY